MTTSTITGVLAACLCVGAGCQPTRVGAGARSPWSTGGNSEVAASGPATPAGPRAGIAAQPSPPPVVVDAPRSPSAEPNASDASAPSATIVPLPRPAPASGVQPPTGQACRVHFRRDALGLSGPTPLPVGQENPAGRATFLAGTVDQVTDDWLVLRTDGRRVWIPLAAVLMVEMTDAQ